MIKEMEFVSSIIKNSPRSALHRNLPFMSDAEIIEVGENFYCLSVDTVSEEISLGLIRSRESLGWLAVTASVSDLAAVGSSTAEVTVSVGRPSHLSEGEITEIESGIQKACRQYGCELSQLEIFEAQQFVISCTAKGRRSTHPLMKRTPLGAGDQLFLTGPCGWGNAVAFANLGLSPKNPEAAARLDEQYRPLARVKESQFIERWAHVCIDTSDGLLFSLDLLQELNSCGLTMKYDPTIFHPIALEVSRLAKVNPWLFFAAQNGEFELLFAVKEEKVSEFKLEFQRMNFPFIHLGNVTAGRALELCSENGRYPLDISPLQNLLFENLEPQKYILALLEFASSNKIPERF